MNIAIHAAELDQTRIDGTRVYLREMLRRFGIIATEHEFHLFHQRDFFSPLAPPRFDVYRDRVLPGRFHWTQTRFAPAVRALCPDRLWMPIQMLPFGILRSTEVVVTIHDLAFKYYPETFPWRDRVRHEWYTDRAVARADRLIAITESTKRDLLRFYPNTREDRIRVIHHGFDQGSFVPESQANDVSVLGRFGVESQGYILFVGAMQPRKNITTLIKAFALAKRSVPEMRLVLGGACAWLWEDIDRAVAASRYRSDIIITGAVSGDDLPSLYRGARVFVYPSLYEGFGIPILEAEASGVPVIAADNSSLSEVGGSDSALYFPALDAESCAAQMVRIWEDRKLADRLRSAGLENIRRFSWDATARETLQWILEEET